MTPESPFPKAADEAFPEGKLAFQRQHIVDSAMVTLPSSYVLDLIDQILASREVCSTTCPASPLRAT